MTKNYFKKKHCFEGCIQTSLLLLTRKKATLLIESLLKVHYCRPIYSTPQLSVRLGAVPNNFCKFRRYRKKENDFDWRASH